MLIKVIYLEYCWAEVTFADGSMGLLGKWDSEAEGYRELSMKQNIVNIKMHELPTKDYNRARKMVNAKNDDLQEALKRRFRRQI